MTSLVSICIPTRDRPELLRACLASCFAQDYGDIEILIGDDSSAGAAEFNTAGPSDFPVRYFRNREPLGQSANVDMLFALARGDRIVLIHDDDLLEPTCVSRLVAAWRDSTIIAFGKQHHITHDGALIESHTTNADYFRSETYVGARPILEAAMLQQIPNNGFLVSAAHARKVGYATPNISVACDTDFSLRLGAAFPNPAGALFVDEFVSVIRESQVSISRNKHAQRTAMPHDKAILFERVRALTVPRRSEWARTIFLDRIAPYAVYGLARSGHRGAAIRTFFSRHIQMHPKRRAKTFARLVVGCIQRDG